MFILGLLLFLLFSFCLLWIKCDLNEMLNFSVEVELFFSRQRQRADLLRFEYLEVLCNRAGACIVFATSSVHLTIELSSSSATASVFMHRITIFGAVCRIQNCLAKTTLFAIMFVAYLVSARGRE